MIVKITPDSRVSDDSVFYLREGWTRDLLTSRHLRAPQAPVQAVQISNTNSSVTCEVVDKWAIPQEGSNWSKF